MNKKIDIFVAHGEGKNRGFLYSCSTNRSVTCKEAKERFYQAKYPAIALADIICRFSKN